MNVDIDGRKKRVLGFCRQENQWNIASLGNEAGVSVTSTKVKLEAFQHYEH